MDSVGSLSYWGSSFLSPTRPSALGDALGTRGHWALLQGRHADPDRTDFISVALQATSRRDFPVWFRPCLHSEASWEILDYPRIKPTFVISDNSKSWAIAFCFAFSEGCQHMNSCVFVNINISFIILHFHWEQEAKMWERLGSFFPLRREELF